MREHKVCTPGKAQRYRKCIQDMIIGLTISSESVNMYDAQNLRHLHAHINSLTVSLLQAINGKKSKSRCDTVNDDGSTRIDQTALGIGNSAHCGVK